MPEQRSPFAVAQYYLASAWHFVQAWGVLLAFDLLLRMASLRWIQARFSFEPAFSDRDANAEVSETKKAAIPRVLRFVQRAARLHLWPMSCLRRALAAQWLLARCGLSCQLTFGARQTGAPTHPVEMHAWLEFRGQPLEPLPEGIKRFEPALLPGCWKGSNEPLRLEISDDRNDTRTKTLQ